MLVIFLLVFTHDSSKSLEERGTKHSSVAFCESVIVMKNGTVAEPKRPAASVGAAKASFFHHYHALQNTEAVLECCNQN